MTGTLTAAGAIHSPYDPAALPLLRAMPGARWDRDAQVWRVSTRPADRTRLLELAGRLGLEVAPELLTAADPPEVAAAKARAITGGAYPYQVEGVAWLTAHKRALLAQDMGLGKTAQVLWSLPPGGRAIVIAPASVKRVWADECHRWRPDLYPMIVSGRDGFFLPKPGQIAVLNYDILPAFLQPRPTGERTRAGKEIRRAEIPPATLEALANCYLILDECHRVKNFRAQRSARIRELSRVCARTWALTGTPLPSRPFDLYGVLDSCGMAYEVFGGWGTFMRLFGGEKDRWGGWTFAARPDPEAPERLRRVMLRRRKSEVLADLPPRTWREIMVNDLEAAHRSELDADWSLFQALGRSEDLPGFTEFSAARARLAAAKTSAAIEIVEEYEEAEEPLVVFSCHRAPVDAIAARPGWGRITGDDSTEARAETVRRFQAGELRGVAATVQAGGVGLTLTRASHVLVIDQPWNPADLAQAVDRVHRIGQDRPVQITLLVADHPLDRHVAGILGRKRILIEGAVEAIAPTPAPPSLDPVVPREQARLEVDEIPPAGRYAIPTQDGARNELAFWIIDRPTEGQWTGWTFLRHQVGPSLEKAGAAKPDGSVTRADVAAVLRRIAEEPEEALCRYGRKLGICGRCGLPLTNDESRSRGLGSVCASRIGAEEH